MNTDEIVKTDNFHAPVLKNKKGDYRMKPGQTVYLGFSTDFLIREADPWRGECWEMIRERRDLNFIFLTKRIERFMECIPGDWADGYDNVTIGCTVGKSGQGRISGSPSSTSFPSSIKTSFAKPLLEQVDLAPYLNQIDWSSRRRIQQLRRPLNYEWSYPSGNNASGAMSNFEFRQGRTNFIKTGKCTVFTSGSYAARRRRPASTADLLPGVRQKKAPPPRVPDYGAKNHPEEGMIGVCLEIRRNFIHSTA